MNLQENFNRQLKLRYKNLKKEIYINKKIKILS